MPEHQSTPPASTLDAHLRAAVAASDVGFALFDADGRLEYANDGYREIACGVADILVPGVEFRTILIESVRRGTIAEAVGREAEWLDERLTVDRQVTGEMELYRNDSKCHLLVRSGPSGGGGFFHVLSDISRQKEAEARLHESERRTHEFAGIAADWYWETDAEGRYSYVSDGFETSTRLAREDILGLTLDEVRDRYITIREDFLHQPDFDVENRRHEYEVDFHHPDGTSRPYLISRMPIRDHDGNVVGQLGACRDISALRALRAEAEDLQRQLRRVQRREAIGEVAGGIAHDFNNLLAVVLGNCELALAQSRDEAGYRRYLERIEQAGERGRDLVRKLLTYSRAVSMQARDCAVEPLVVQAIELARAMLPSSVRCEVEVTPGLCAVAVDPASIEQVLMNLCINAADAMEGVGTIRISASRFAAHEHDCISCGVAFAGDYVAITVADNGSGVPAGQSMEHLFEPFFTTKEVGRGTGLGLSVVHGIVHELGGHILAESAPGAGFTMRLLLPEAEGCVGASEDDAEDSGRRGPSASRAMSVLVIDDDPAVCEMIADTLEAAGQTTARFSSPAAALDRLRETPGEFDAVVTDLTMPGMSGVDVAREAKAIVDIPVVLCTGYEDRMDAADAGRAGVDVLLKKPIDFAQLISALSVRVGETGAARS